MHVAFPIAVQGSVIGVVAVDIASNAGLDLQAVFRQLQWGSGWLEAALRRRQNSGDASSLARANAALDLLAVAGEHARLQVAATALVNELAARYDCERVSLGFHERRGMRLRAMSHSAWFQRKAELIGRIESAMDEAFDQRQSTSYPLIPGTQKRIAIAHKDLVSRGPIGSAVSVPFSGNNGVAGIITLERRTSEPFDIETLQTLELLGSLAGPVLELQRSAERLLTGRAIANARSGLAAVFGPRRPAVKLAVVASLCVIGFLSFAKSEFRVSGKAVLEGSVQRAAVVPFDGFLAQALVRPGDLVRKGETLAVLEDRDLTLERTRWEIEVRKLQQKYRDAQSQHDRLAMQLLQAQIDQAEAQRALAADKLSRSRIGAAIDGFVVSGDLSQMLGAPVQQGKVLFEVAPLDSYRVVLHVDEEDIRHVSLGQQGQLAVTGAAGQTVPFRVSRLTSVAAAEEGRNFFRVEADLLENDLPLRPGMEGIGKIDIGQRSLLWVATRSLIERTRLFVWSWIP
ncbi:HlyD family efflux transporter periplasmic adaptor subunit (plasmid) [Rhizobium sp. WSM1274]|uniref:efflux RND transporter periplasmic adaptor subunit n=1 Tax=Rhizobium sp. WSM1274 TaxID=3138254 RepID=UPI0021A9482C|nr:HlyD family efflux transporter periplasmic adaptor subunit [Rhizobium leguminosarum]UWU31673.1 HlyD family efflux transporter periplasmic adaptor subunit [Rhizobium leguminosarum bv. viciae]